MSWTAEILGPGEAFVQEENRRYRARWRSMGTVSTVAHAIVLAMLFLYEPPEPASAGFTEIAWMDAPATTAPPLPPEASAAAADPIAPVEAPAPVEERFERPTETAVEAPTPQRVEAIGDRLRERLTASSSLPDRPTALSVSSPTTSSTSSARLAAAAAPTPSKSLALTRGATEPSTAPARALTRGASTETRDRTLATLESRSTTTSSRPSAAAISTAIDSAGVNLAEATLAGPVADRPLRQKATPEYPDWAKRRGVEGTVSLYFEVQPDGRIKPNVLVQRSSGHQAFDDNAVAALRSWRFEPLSGGRTGDQWGTITFVYRLSESS